MRIHRPVRVLRRHWRRKHLRNTSGRCSLGPMGNFGGHAWATAENNGRIRPGRGPYFTRRVLPGLAPMLRKDALDSGVPRSAVDRSDRPTRGVVIPPEAEAPSPSDSAPSVGPTRIRASNAGTSSPAYVPTGCWPATAWPAAGSLRRCTAYRTGRTVNRSCCAHGEPGAAPATRPGHSSGRHPGT